MTKVDSGLKKSEPARSPEQAANSAEDWQRDALGKVIPVRMTPDVETKSAIIQKHAFAATRKFRTMQHLQNSMFELREIAARMNYAGTNKTMKLNFPWIKHCKLQRAASNWKVFSSIRCFMHS